MKKSFKQTFMTDTLPPLVMGAILIFIFQFVTGWLGISERVFPRLTSIWAACVEFFKNGGIKDVWATTRCMLLGYCIAVPLGMIAAGLLAQSKVAVKAFNPLIIMLATTPLLVLVPMLMIWIGLGPKVRVFAVALQATPIVLLNTLAGFTNVATPKNEIAALYGSSRMNRFFKIVVPQAWPRIFTGLRLGVINATLGVVSAEFVCKTEGLGNRILVSTSLLNIPMVYGSIFMVAIISRVLMTIVTKIEKRVVIWNNR